MGNSNSSGNRAGRRNDTDYDTDYNKGPDGNEQEYQRKNTSIRSLGFTIESRSGTRNTKHFVGAVENEQVAQGLDLRRGDELLVLDNRSLTDVPHSQVVQRFKAVKANFTMLSRRLNEGTGERYEYLTMDASINRTKKKSRSASGTRMQTMESRLSGDTLKLPLHNADRHGVLVKSLGHPTKGIKGNYQHIFVDTVTGRRGDNQMDLLYYICWPPRPSGHVIATLVRRSPNVYLKARPDMTITSQVGGVDLENPSDDVLFWQIPGSDPHLVSFRSNALQSAGYVCTDGSPYLSLHSQPGNPDSLFEIL